MSDDPQTERASLATQVFQHRAMAEAYRLRAGATRDEAWRDLYLRIAATYDRLATEVGRAVVLVNEIDAHSDRISTQSTPHDE